MVSAMVMALYAPSDGRTEPHHRAFAPWSGPHPVCFAVPASRPVSHGILECVVWKNAVAVPAGAHPGMLKANRTVQTASVTGERPVDPCGALGAA
jgi:hypothetical protein